MSSKIKGFMGRLLALYIIILLFILPFYMTDAYNQLGLAKFELYKNASVLFLGLLLVLCAVWYVSACLEWKTWKVIHGFSLTDYFVFAYLAVLICSYLFSSYREDAFWGANGWFMGLFSQFTFVLIYFYTSRCLWQWRILAALGGASTAVVFLFAILQRFSIDPLRLHEDLSPDVQLQFLSTLGQATWYSSFLCVCFPVAIGIYYAAGRREVKLLSGGYLVIAMASLVTQNSDSAFFALGTVLLALFYLAFKGREQMKAFLEVVLLILSAFGIVGYLQRSFPEQAVRLERLSMFMTQDIRMRLLFPCVLTVYILFLFWDKPDMEELYFIRNAVFIILPLLAVGTVFFIILNTNGYLFHKYGWFTDNNYLWFNDNWGSGRGSSWKLAWRALTEMPGVRKLIGAGPDCFGFYCYDQPVYERILVAKWGGSTLTNAHNEFLNSAVCYGILGLASYIGVLVSGILRFLKKWETAAPGRAWALLGPALVIVSYMGHNFFCYQQVLCTPYLFLALGVGEAYCRKNCPY